MPPPANLPPRHSLRQFAGRLLERLHLSGAAFRVHEFVKTRRLARTAGGAFAAPAADGLPLPPPALMVLVGGETTPAAFLDGGAAVVAAMREMLHAAGTDLERCRAVLDFGCGCGRVMRHLAPLAPAVRLDGTDYNPRLIEWSRRHLPFAAFDVNALAPPLRHAASAFDLAYAFSVFTHLPANLQEAWLRELARVIAPGGHLFLTVHGASFRDTLDVEERARFDAGELVVRHARNAGSNLCTAFHPASYLARVAAPEFTIVGHAPARLGQDAVLLRRSAA
ncbi:MAG TPA: class I SAM-dependent methyltransferase [Rudaea sp.]|nr:class I SAM-dependent methyltransferase [Rudaea sp.]